MINGWLSLRVRNPEEVAAWYAKLGLQISAGRPESGTIVVGTNELGRIIVLIPGEPLEHPERLQLHIAVADVDAEYLKLKMAGVEVTEAPKDMPWGWRHLYTRDPAGHVVELCTPLPSTVDRDSQLQRPQRGNAVTA